jgi:PKD domain
MRRFSYNARRTVLALVAAVVASLGVVASGAQAVVLNDQGDGAPGVTAGVALAPGARAWRPTDVTAVSGPSPCTDPWLSTDLGGGHALPGNPLCYDGGAVMHKNETFALTWDQPRAYWSLTRGYVEQFLRDVADSSGSLASPFAVTTQYNDNAGRAQNQSIFGGGCIDYGTTGGANCEYGSTNGPGHDYQSSTECPVTGDSFVTPTAVTPNDICLTDADLKNEVATMVSQTGILGRTQPGYTPLVTLLTPPTVKVCLDAAGELCSVNGKLTPPLPTVTSANTGTGHIPTGAYRVRIAYDMGGGNLSAASASVPVNTSSTPTEDSSITVTSPPDPSADTGHNWNWRVYVTQSNGSTYIYQSTAAVGTDITLDNLAASGAAPPPDTGFCSYHAQASVGGTEVAYVVQPWTAGTECDEPDAPPIPQFPTPQQMAIGVGQRLVSPLSQSEMAAITDPALNGWLGQDGTEIDDNAGCVPVGNQLDQVTLGTSGQNPYFLQRESNNAGVLEFDPATYFGCAPQVDLAPQFVVPSAADQGDEVQFDGSATDSTLMVPNAGYSWSFGDGTTATGPSVVHSYANGGTYTVKLTVTDRGGNTDTLAQQIQVLGGNGQPVASPAPAPAPPTTSPSPGTGTPGGSLLTARLQLLPQSLKAVLRSGIAVRVTSSKPANGIATVWITRATAKKAGIQVGRGQTVRIGLGTVSSITNGTVTLRLHLSPAVAKKLSHLHRLTLSVRLALVAPGNQQVAVDVAGRY